MRTVAVVAVLFPAFAFSQFGGEGQYPQFRATSGLPGSGYGVTSGGDFGINGAWAIATPIAYSLKPWKMSFSFGAVSKNIRPQFVDATTNESNGNGSATFTVGLPLGKFGQATYSYMILSSRLDNAGNLTWTPPQQQGPITFAVGVQDIGGGAGTRGEGKDGSDPGNSRSYFVVGTWEGPNGLHVSLGQGSTRFKKLFGNASANIGARAKAVAEFDGYNWNYGLGYDLGTFGKGIRKDVAIGASTFIGVIRGGYLTWSVGIRF